MVIIQYLILLHQLVVVKVEIILQLELLVDPVAEAVVMQQEQVVQVMQVHFHQLKDMLVVLDTILLLKVVLEAVEQVEWVMKDNQVELVLVVLVNRMIIVLVLMFITLVVEAEVLVVLIQAVVLQQLVETVEEELVVLMIRLVMVEQMVLVEELVEEVDG